MKDVLIDVHGEAVVGDDAVADFGADGLNLAGDSLATAVFAEEAKQLERGRSFIELDLADSHLDIGAKLADIELIGLGVALGGGDRNFDAHGLLGRANVGKDRVNLVEKSFAEGRRDF